MASPLIECVPNFSEGRRRDVLDALRKSIESVANVKLLSLEPDGDYNRTVVTFVGPPHEVAEAAFRAAAAAAGLIDMTIHKGEHPRLGAIDVVPFIPISGATMDDCVHVSRLFGKRLWNELRIPVYLYERAATNPGRKNLSDIRKGEYEGLRKKLEDPYWKPDYGDPVFNPKAGATVTGARKFLIAYNVNLNTPDQSIAQEIALRIRESGRIVKDSNGETKRDAQGKPVKIPGTLKAVKAMGVYLERLNIAQVSINLVDFETTSMHDAFEEVRKQARELGVDATGSELVGLAPLEAFRLAGKYFSDGSGQDDSTLVDIARKRLGLEQLDRFIPEKKIIELML